MDLTPSKLWKEYLTENRNYNGAAAKSLQLYKEKYLMGQQKGEEKFTTKVLIAGKIYTFQYIDPSMPSSDKPVIDHFPVLLSFGHVTRPGKVYEFGIDLMMVPPTIRPLLMDRVWKYFRNVINENEKNIDAGQRGIKPLKLNFQVAKKVFEHLGWQMALMVFDRTKMVRISVVDYTDWPAMCALYTNGLKGKRPEELYRSYMAKITNMPVYVDPTQKVDPIPPNN